MQQGKERQRKRQKAAPNPLLVPSLSLSRTLALSHSLTPLAPNLCNSLQVGLFSLFLPFPSLSLSSLPNRVRSVVFCKDAMAPSGQSRAGLLAAQGIERAISSQHRISIGITMLEGEGKEKCRFYFSFSLFYILSSVQCKAGLFHFFFGSLRAEHDGLIKVRCTYVV